jgi:hypothetical protein
MENKTIEIISRYIKENPNMSNNQLGALIKEKTTLTYSQGTLQNYISRVKKLGKDALNTISASTTGDEIDEPKVTKTIVTNIVAAADFKENYIGGIDPIEEPVELKPLTSKEHIRGYLLAYTDKNFSEIARMLYDADLCTEFTIGTLRNYISAEARNIGDTQKRVKSTSSEVLLKETKKEVESKYTHIKNHEVILVDASTCQASDVQYVVDHAGEEVSTLFTVIAFSENTIVASSKQEKPQVKFTYQPTLGINLLSSISTACHLAATKDMVGYNTNLTIITSGGDNMSKELSYEDVRYALDELIHDHKWTVNLIFTGERKEEGFRIAQWLGIDSSNVTTGYFDPQVINNSMHKRINKLKSEEETSLNYYK